MKSLLQSPVAIKIDTFRCMEGVDDSGFLHHAAGCALETPSAVLLSGGEVRHIAANRYSIAAWDPMVQFRSKGSLCGITYGNDWQQGSGDNSPGGLRNEFQADPLNVLDRLGSNLNPSFGLVPPFSGGAIGYLSYDLKNVIERLPVAARDDLGLPDLFLFWPRRILVHDREEKTLNELVFRMGEEDPKLVRRCNALRNPNRKPLRTGALQSSFTHQEYLEAVRKVREYICGGDVYQVNLSQRFQFALEGDPFQLWKSLFGMNPASFYAFINAGDHQVLSTSMERFLFRSKDFIETRPIKGTRKRGKTMEEDRQLAAELLQSPKDDAELSMIVDLLRNDLGRVCRPRTVRVAEHKMLETYGNVHHLVSIVTGQLESGTTPGNIIRAAFPGGSITGCPKIRAMEIIDELEPCVRHVYTGAVGYLGWHDNLDLNVAIRTAIVKGETCYFSVGGGIVYDSDEEEEYRETLHKGRTLFELMEKIGGAR